ncbi:MAG: LapD/MoxY N-terminal periplasmic domain-containing protein [Aeromonas sp.]
MSLAKLLSRIILVLFVIGAVLLLILELTTVRQSILDQMSANLETAITALGLVLQGTLLNDDQVLAETIVNAMFDGGFVSAVTLVDPDGKVLFERAFNAGLHNVPSWLPHIVTMPPVRIAQELTDGWRLLGTLTLEGHVGYAYQHLWKALSRTGLALAIGLVLFTFVTHWVCARMLKPLNDINGQLVQIRQHQYNQKLSTPWLSDLKQVAGSINQLVSERKRDLLQQRLKLTQLGKQRPQPAVQGLVGLAAFNASGAVQHFFSTQGEIALYKRFVPSREPTSQSSTVDLLALLEPWRSSGAEGLRLPLSLLNHPHWRQLQGELSLRGHKIIDWTWDLSQLTAAHQQQLSALQQAGLRLAFSNIPFSTEVLNSLDPLNPVFISCQPSAEPLYWHVLSQTMHAAGYTLLAEAGGVMEVDTLRTWGIDGYAKEAHV